MNDGVARRYMKNEPRRRNLWVTDIQSALEGPARAAGEPNVRYRGFGCFCS
jgi:hypothetical protein